ncbi:regulator [Halobacteriales archaeon SW_7_68_16]|nr:MAG: regulator [Halobacteriales archaeon SW_7_68_16]
MSVETAGEADADRTVDDVARELGERLAELPEYEAFVEAKTAVENDEEAQAAIEEFEAVRREFALARQTGEADKEDLRELHRKQNELDGLAVMREYREAGNELDARLEAIDDAVSAALELDFGERIGGCCQD